MNLTGWFAYPPGPWPVKQINEHHSDVDNIVLLPNSGVLGL